MSKFAKRLLIIGGLNSVINLFIIASLDKYSAWTYGFYLTLFGWVYASIVTAIFLKTLPKDEDVGPGDQVFAWFMMNASVYWCEVILGSFAVLKLK